MVSLVLRTGVVLLLAGSLVSCQQSPTGSVRSAPPSPDTPLTEPSSKTPTPVGTAYEAAAPEVSPSDGRPRRALLSIRALSIRNLAVIPYVGKTDDAPGTRIQDSGVAASPHGSQGGVGPGGIGNYQVTAHRTSSTRAFLMLPRLQVGERAVVEAGGVRYVYEIARTRTTSFRSARSLAEQRAAVPGHPGATPTRGFLTLSTCATPEDHAKGNYWSDRFGNPEHRIDKIGVLIRTEEAN